LKSITFHRFFRFLRFFLQMPYQKAQPLLDPSLFETYHPVFMTEMNFANRYPVCRSRPAILGNFAPSENCCSINCLLDNIAGKI